MYSLKILFSAITFLTKIPIPYHPSIKSDDFCKNSRFFPLVGLLLGSILYIISTLTISKMSSLMSALLVVFIYIVLTGGLHLDGVGDSFDGLFSYQSREKMLEIMKDSRIGTFGLLGIVFVILFKIVAINDLLKDYRLIPILLMPIVGRMSLVLNCYKGVNARTNGMGITFIGNIGNKDLIIAVTTVIISIIAFSYTFGLIFLLKILCGACVALVISILIRTWVYKKINGITGDILGLICELTEVFFLLVFLIIS